MATTKAVSSTGAAAPAPASSYISYRFVLAASVAIVSHYFVFTPLKRFLPFHQKYSDLVVFGASYNDNGHSRAPEYSASLKTAFPYMYGGRYQDGPVSTEYMSLAESDESLEAEGLAYANYAYGGSTGDNRITSSPFPATRDQIAHYYEDLLSGEQVLGKGRLLLYINTGINQMTKVWLEALAAGTNEVAIDNAVSLVSENVEAVIDQMKSLIKQKLISSHKPGFDLLIVGIPPLEMTPYSQSLAAQDSEKLELLELLVLQYNLELAQAAKALKVEVKKMKVLPNVFYYDMAKLWRSIYADPESYGISPDLVMQSCYNSTTSQLCKNPDQRLYFDQLHPVTSIQKTIAGELVKTLRGRL